MKSKPVFVFASAEDCGACIGYYPIWEEGKSMIENDKRIQLVQIKLKSLRDPIPAKYPQDLKRYIGWFPSFFLFTGESWDNSKKNPNHPLEGSIYYGILNNGMPENIRGPPPFPQNLKEFIDRELNSPLFKNSSYNDSPLLSNIGDMDDQKNKRNTEKGDNMKYYIPTSGKKRWGFKPINS